VKTLKAGDNDMYTRLMITLNGDEANALMHIADQELRDPREQLRLFLREEMRRRGFLKPEQERMAAQVDAQPTDSHDRV
jgi:hypothetical protein